MRKNILIAAIIGVVLGVITLMLTNFPKEKSAVSTYFQYSANEMHTINKLHSDLVLNTTDLKKWDNVMFRVAVDHKLGDADAARFYAYLYEAQREVANLSYQISGKFSGNIDAVSTMVICYFFNDVCQTIQSRVVTDAYSSQLANIVFAKIKARILSEKQNEKMYFVKNDPSVWKGTTPFFGQNVGSWRPWYIKNGAIYRAKAPPAPGSAEWQSELNTTKKALANISFDQTKQVIFWAGNPGTITPPGQWLLLANDYMLKNNVPLEKVLTVRANLAMGIVDALIAVFDSKYTYLVKRPNMLDPSIITVMPTPNTPSYPAGHATLSATAALILKHYFPENNKKWDEYAHQAAYSRIWGGIHYNIDTQAGFTMGEKVGEDAIKHGVGYE